MWKTRGNEQEVLTQHMQQGHMHMSCTTPTWPWYFGVNSSHSLDHTYRDHVYGLCFSILAQIRANLHHGDAGLSSNCLQLELAVCHRHDILP
jgi:hypothetical protein